MSLFLMGFTAAALLFFGLNDDGLLKAVTFLPAAGGAFLLVFALNTTRRYISVSVTEDSITEVRSSLFGIRKRTANRADFAGIRGEDAKESELYSSNDSYNTRHYSVFYGVLIHREDRKKDMRIRLNMEEFNSFGAGNDETGKTIREMAEKLNLPVVE